MDGFDPKTGEALTPLLPLSTELNQAILCDDMPALANIQIGPTGRSVSRSYGATLSKLVPKGMSLFREEHPHSLDIFRHDRRRGGV